MTPIVYIDVYKCGVKTETIGFAQLKDDDILTQFAKIEYTAKRMIDDGNWDRYKINHICVHSQEVFGCPKLRDEKNVSIVK